MSNYYNKTYFSSKIFDYDYKPIAEAIYTVYKPRTIIEFGCGNGELAKAFSELPVSDYLAIDGYSEPNFATNPKIRFQKIDLNSVKDIESFLASLNGQRFDVAISMEVAEHIQPGVSSSLVHALTQCADTVIFSAALPGQDGDGHINCQTRTYWDSLFREKNYYLFDTIRATIRSNKNVGRWYQLNTCDYRKVIDGPTREQYDIIVKNLIASESAASSFFYISNRKYDLLKHWLNLDIIALSFRFRNFIKRTMGKKPLQENIID